MKSARIVLGLMVCSAAVAGLWQPPTWFNIDNWGLETLTNKDSVFGTVSLSLTGRLARPTTDEPLGQSELSLTPYPDVCISGRYMRFCYSIAGTHILNVGNYMWNTEGVLFDYYTNITVYSLSGRLGWIFFDKLMLWAGYDHHFGYFYSEDWWITDVNGLGSTPSFSAGCAVDINDNLGIDVDVSGPSRLDMEGSVEAGATYVVRGKMLNPLSVKARARIDTGSGLDFLLGCEYTFTSWMDSMYFEVAGKSDLTIRPWSGKDVVSVSAGAGYNVFGDVTLYMWGNYSSPSGFNFVSVPDAHTVSLAGGIGWEPGRWELRLVLGGEAYQLLMTEGFDFTGEGLLASFSVLRQF